MANKNLDTRIINKHDTEENWSKANFIPKQGELIIYDVDNNHYIERFKIGDGTTSVNNLPFRSIDGGYDGFIKILPETTLNFTNSTSLLLTDCQPIELDKKYIVTFDNTDYELISRGDSEGYGEICIGNLLYGFDGADTGEPFLIHSINNNTHIDISPSTTLPCTYNIKIKVFTLVKIDEKYLDIKNTNIINGNKTGSLRTVGSAEENSSYTMGEYAFAEGNNTKASGNFSHAEGAATKALGESSHAEGDTTTASGIDSHAEGSRTTASGWASHAEGQGTAASGDNSHAEGGYTTASGLDSHAEGRSTKASGNFSHAEGDSTTALGNYSHAEGDSTTAGQMGFTVTNIEQLTDTTGIYTLNSITGLEVNQRYSVHFSSSKEDCGKITAIDTTNKKITVDGFPNIGFGNPFTNPNRYLTIVNRPDLGDVKASGNDSHAEGYSTIASSDHQHVQGRLNIEDSIGTYADIIGNGNVRGRTRSNAATVDWNGNAWYAGDVYVGSTSGTNRDEGSKKLATEDYVNSKIKIDSF